MPDPPLGGFGTGLSSVTERDIRGFRIIHLHASTPVTIALAPAGNGAASNLAAALLAP